MELRVVHEVGADELHRLKRLFEVVQAHEDHQPLGEHKWLDLVHGRGYVGVMAAVDGDIVGYAHVSRHADEQWGLEIVANPSHRDGLEMALAEKVLALVAEGGGGHVHYWVFRPRPIHDEIAARLGFRHGRDLLYVCAPLPVAEEPGLPAGIRLRSFEAGRDEQAWLEVNNRAFDHHPEQGAWDLETLRRRMGEPWFDPQDFLLAVDDAGVAGFNWTKIHADGETGEIYVIGVDPSRRGARLGKALTLAGLEHLAQRGVRRCCLYVDAANETALGMYERIGFEIDHLDRAYAADVDPA